MFSKRILIGQSGTIIDNCLWLCSEKIGVLMKINICTETLEEVYPIPECEIMGHAVGDCIEYNGKLFLVPCNMDYMYAFDLLEKNFERIDVVEDCNKSQNNKYGKSFMYKGKLFLVGQEGTKNIKVYDICTKKIIKTIRYDEKMCKSDFEWVNNMSSFVIDAGHAYLNVMGCGALLSLDLDTYEMKYIYVDNTEYKDGIVSICDVENSRILLSGRNGELGVWSINSGVESVINTSVIGGFEKIISTGKGKVCIPLYDTAVRVYDGDEIKDVYINYRYEDKIRWKYRFKGIYNDTIIFQSGYSGTFYSLEIESRDVVAWDCSVDKEKERSLSEIILKKKEPFFEDDMYTLKDFFGYISEIC